MGNVIKLMEYSHPPTPSNSLKGEPQRACLHGAVSAKAGVGPLGIQGCALTKLNLVTLPDGTSFEGIDTAEKILRRVLKEE